MGYKYYYTLYNTNDGLYYGNITNGYGEIYYKDGSSYRGLFNKGLFNGYGIYSNNEYYYEGDFEMSSINGYGKTITNNEIYIGEYKNNMKNGKGTIYTDKYKFTGYYTDNKKNGIGYIIYTNKQIFVILYEMDEIIQILTF